MEPGRIILGGGVMLTPGLIERVRDSAIRLGKGYFKGNPGDIVVPPALGDQAGLLGGLALAQDMLAYLSAELPDQLPNDCHDVTMLKYLMDFPAFSPRSILTISDGV